MNAVDALLTYWSQKNMDGQPYSQVQISRYDLNVVAVKIMSWLRLEHKRTMWMSEGKEVTHKPLKLDMRYPWCINLEKLVEEDDLFRNYFSIKDDELHFSSVVSEQERAAMREKVYNSYVPPRNE